MAKYVFDGIIQLHFVEGLDGIADYDAPTLAEIVAGTNLTPFMMGLNTPMDGSTVDAATAESRYNTTAAGTYGGQALEFTFTRDQAYAADTAWTTFPPPGGSGSTEGLLVAAWRGGSGSLDEFNMEALAVGDRVDVWPVEVISRNPAAYARNELAKGVVQFAVPTPPSLDVAIASAS